ncbi:TPA: hypothetical protein ME655_003230 [Klebsiella pneumoniae]|nr:MULTISPECIES: hypothetical protein [Klebsiella]ELA0278773.1 hypothetical protein [Klebsiella pneumoniae]ELA0283922.1 hypothetical protein [Klebsiella pneumoniae]ELA0288823.1 hypothetical protein [Klebsiella pneumoniae]MEB6027616.1 hypothetical protein [Klebsiella quasipneumoniae]UMF27460.1 hypothetical protein JJW41_16960 [Klebsiella pneumoniae]
MIKNRVERYAFYIILSILSGVLASSVVYLINYKLNVLVEMGNILSKTLSLITAAIVGLLIKRYVDLQDKIRDLDLPKKTPPKIVASFEGQRDEYFKLIERNSMTYLYLGTGLLLVLLCMVMPLESLKKVLDIGYFISVDTGFTITTLIYLLCLGFEVVKVTESARKMKRYFDGLIATEISRQELIDALNKSLREQRGSDTKEGPKVRENKEFNLRGYIESLENKKNDDAN